MSNDGTARVRFFPKQFLRAEDFACEQAHHLAMRRRHNVAQHVWGIAAGLEPRTDDAGQPFVMPGVAIDGYGRELVLPERQPLPLADFEERDSDVLDVWLEYDRQGTDPAPRGWVDCGADPASSPYRWLERPLVRTTVPDPAFPDRRRPRTVPEADFDFRPERLPPDDPQQDWPVFLGRVERRRPAPGAPIEYVFDLAERPWVGLVGEAIVAPSGRARVQVGAEREDDPNRFAVFVLDDPNAVPGAADPEPILAINDAGRTTIAGDATVRGGVTVREGFFEFVAGAAGAGATVPTARAWSIFRVVEPAAAPTAAGPAAAAPADSTRHELRIALPEEGAATDRVVIGHWSEQQRAFRPCLTIAGDGDVTVHGNLVIEGDLVETQQRAAALLDDAARNFMVAAQHSGVAGTAGILPEFYRTVFPVPTRAVHAAVVDRRFGDAADSVVAMLRGDPAFLDAVAGAIRGDTDLTSRITSALQPPPDPGGGGPG